MKQLTEEEKTSEEAAVSHTTSVTNTEKFVSDVKHACTCVSEDERTRSILPFQLLLLVSVLNVFLRHMEFPYLNPCLLTL